MKRTLALFLAVMLVFAGCKAANPKDAFFSALEKQGEIKNAHEVVTMSWDFDNDGAPYRFFDLRLEGDVSLENLDMAVQYDFTMMDISMKMELYKKGEDVLVKMPIVAKYLQLPSDMIPAYQTEEMASMQELISQESKALYEQMGESLQFSSKGSEIVASYELSGEATKTFLNDVFLEKILKNETIRQNAIDQSVESQRKALEQYGFSEDYTDEDWAAMRESAEEAYDHQIEEYSKVIEKMEIESLKGETTVSKEGHLSGTDFELKLSMYDTPMTIRYNAALTNINKVSEIKLPELNPSNIVTYSDLIRGKFSLDDLNPFFGMIQRMEQERMEEYWDDWQDEEDLPSSVPLPETGTPARPAI